MNADLPAVGNHSLLCRFIWPLLTQGAYSSAGLVVAFKISHGRFPVHHNGADTGNRD